MARHLRALAALIAVLLSAGGLAACGSSSGGGGSATQLLKDTFGANRPVRSGKLDVALNLNAAGLQGLKGPVALKLAGPFESQGKGKLPKFDFSLTLNSGASSFSAGAVSTGDKGFLKVQGTTYAVTDQLFQQFKQGYEQAAAKSSSQSGGLSFKSLGVDPLRWLKDPKNAGSDEVGGADTYHVTATIDVARFLDDVNKLLAKAGSLGGQSANIPSGLTSQQRQDIQRSVSSAKFDLWTGKSDKTLRKLAIDLGIAVPADVQKRAGGLKNGELTFELTIADLNKSQTISAPGNARPLSDLTKALGTSTGTATSPAAPTTTTPVPQGTATTPSSSSGSSKYLDCLQKAGNDVSKIQKCAALLNG